MQNMRPFKSVCPLRNELHLDITTAVKVTANLCGPSAEHCLDYFSTSAGEG